MRGEEIKRVSKDDGCVNVLLSIMHLTCILYCVFVILSHFLCVVDCVGSVDINALYRLKMNGTQ